MIAFLFLMAQAGGAILEEFPTLKEHHFREPDSGLRLGMGLTPVGVTDQKVTFGLNAFQIHWMNWLLDVEAASVSIHLTYPREVLSKSRHFIFRTSPKVRVFKIFSIGPLAGYEFVSFPETIARLRKGQFVSPKSPFSSRGVIFGGMASQLFKLSDTTALRINEVVYKQTYSTTEADLGWSYEFEDEDLQADPARDLIKPGVAILIEASILF